MQLLFSPPMQEYPNTHGHVYIYFFVLFVKCKGVAPKVTVNLLSLQD